MPAAPRVCAQPGCPALVTTRTCKAHTRTTTQRGYGHTHRKHRAAIALIVDAGRAHCTRCHQPIAAGQPWHLDHDDNDRTQYLGASHTHCNLAAATRARHRP